MQEKHETVGIVLSTGVADLLFQTVSRNGVIPFGKALPMQTANWILICWRHFRPELTLEGFVSVNGISITEEEVA